MSDEVIKGTEPAKDKDEAEKGATLPAPLPASKRPSKDEELKKAQATLVGKDPELVELVEELEQSKKLVKVVKDGEEPLRIHPATLDGHLAAGWRVADEELDAARKKADAKAEDDGASRKPADQVEVRRLDEHPSPGPKKSK